LTSGVKGHWKVKLQLHVVHFLHYTGNALASNTTVLGAHFEAGLAELSIFFDLQRGLALIYHPIGIGFKYLS
jgi:hypothetical protein